MRILFAGLLFFVAGLFFILHQFYGAAFLTIAVPVLVMLGGLFYLYLSIARRGNSRYFISGVFLFLLGTFLIFFQIIFPDMSFKAMWPVFMLVFGIILLVYSLCMRPRQIQILVPSVAICIMALVFIPFSFKLITVSLFKFVATWWPLLFIIVGMVLLTVYFISLFRKSRKN